MPGAYAILAGSDRKTGCVLANTDYGDLTQTPKRWEKAPHEVYRSWRVLRLLAVPTLDGYLDAVYNCSQFHVNTMLEKNC